MIRVLKNNGRTTLKNHFRGRDVVFKSKHSISFKMDDEEDKALYRFWKSMYSFLQDITDRVEAERLKKIKD